MRHHAASPASSLPSLMMPCPVCAGRMVYHGRRLIAADVEDTIYACKRCGAELIRTSVRKASGPDVHPAAAEHLPSLRAKRSNAGAAAELDCFVASLLAMTAA